MVKKMINEKNLAIKKIEDFLQELFFEDNSLFSNLEKVIKQINLLNLGIIHKMNQYVCVDLSKLDVKTIFLCDIDSVKYRCMLYNPEFDSEKELSYLNLIFRLIKSIIRNSSIKKFFI